jgi:hypothetical protein
MATPTKTPPAPGDLAFDTVDRDGWPLLRPTLLTIHRTSPDDARTRQVYFSLDGKRIATLLFGQQVTREIPPGRHKLRANNTLVWKTVEFEADPGAHLHYTCVNRAPSSLYFMLFIFGVAPLYVVLRPGMPPTAPPTEG